MTYAEAVQEFKRKYWIDLLALCGQNVNIAAQLSGVNRTHIYTIIDTLGIPFDKSRTAHRGNWGRYTD